MYKYKRYIIIIIAFILLSIPSNVKVFANFEKMPFYDLQPKDLVCRSAFYTTYSSSSDERKSNIELASKSLNNVIIDVNAEFSFNKFVGVRSEKNGYKKAKIILDGEFVDGVGGGVCQVSTTLYNAILLSGLKVIEYHPHSLPVGYIAPSFDAMVSSYADLKFINDTHNPIILKTFTDGNVIRIEVWGEKSPYKYERESIVTGEIIAPKEQEKYDDEGNYPDLYEGDKLVVKYSKNGLTSEGYIIAKINGKIKQVKKIRKDKYNAQCGLIVYGKATKENVENNLETKE